MNYSIQLGFLIAYVISGCLCTLKSACLGHNDGCCTELNPCPEGYGDCDNSHQCGKGLRCGYNNCDPSFLPPGTKHKFNGGDDCCERRQPCTYGDSGCCTDSMPCDEGEGDCDFDSQCRGSLVFGESNCRHEQLKGMDCCEKWEVRAAIIRRNLMLTHGL